MTKKELQINKEARIICAWLEYRGIEPPKELLEIAIDKHFASMVLGDYPTLSKIKCNYESKRN